MKRKKITLMIGYLFCFYLAKTQVIFSEPFNEATNSTSGVDNVGSVSWLTACPTCSTGDYFNVQSGALQCDDTNGSASWTTGNIDVSSCTNGYIISLDISTAAATNAFEECTSGCGCNCVDWISLEYNANGTGFVPLSSAQGGTCAQTCSGGTYILLGALSSGTAYTFSTCLPAVSSLVLRITVQTWAGGEIYRIDNVTVTCNSGPCILPIELLEFEVQDKIGAVEAIWTTVSEKDNSYFTLQRSVDAINFENILNVKGAGDSYTVQRYSATDDKPLKGTLVYYRLRQTDFDGNFTFSQIIPLLPSNLVKDIKVFPIPSKDGIFEFLANEKNEDIYSIEVYDMLGTKVKVLFFTGNRGVVDLSGMSKGIYLLIFNTAKDAITKRVLID